MGHHPSRTPARRARELRRDRESQRASRIAHDSSSIAPPAMREGCFKPNGWHARRGPGIEGRMPWPARPAPLLDEHVGGHTAGVRPQTASTLPLRPAPSPRPQRLRKVRAGVRPPQGPDRELARHAPGSLRARPTRRRRVARKIVADGIRSHAAPVIGPASPADGPRPQEIPFWADGGDKRAPQAETELSLRAPKVRATSDIKRRTQSRVIH
ncbi:uncharacterized protein BXZ73DRAFT_78249 [Epithele typhae]|uniref:uncharacterized protein n=1 Tax=Epithele typhae TaxID=378194 RepID=UPI002008492B|nr:uncharacterized protein BXZ73DRAFT_78249 [Epithele typhae]KAH9929113.1 hypothetical protein BXZ73DRAFT_78249 [Epithele typhae]